MLPRRRLCPVIITMQQKVSDRQLLLPKSKPLNAPQNCAHTLSVSNIHALDIVDTVTYYMYKESPESAIYQTHNFVYPDCSVAKNRAIRLTTVVTFSPVVQLKVVNFQWSIREQWREIPFVGESENMAARPHPTRHSVILFPCILNLPERQPQRILLTNSF